MALLKTGYKNGAGVMSEYWRVIDYKLNAQFKYVDMTFGGWVDETARVNNLENSDTPRKVRCMKDKFDVYFSTEALNVSGNNPVLQMYKYAKENEDFFIGATDLLDTVVEGDPIAPSKSTADLLQDKIDMLQTELTSTKSDLADAQGAIDFIACNYS